MSRYPDFRMDSRWISSLRGEKAEVDPFVPYGFFNEPERMHGGEIEEVSTLLLSNKECPYRCLMCDLWKNTTEETVPPGAIPAQITFALQSLTPAKHIKLYNSGSFFDRSAIPYADYRLIASLLSSFKTVVVESHTAFIGKDTLEFNSLIEDRLEVAIGLETIHPEVLPRLNKKMTLADFKFAVDYLTTAGIKSRAFVLLRPPFMKEAEGIEWAKRSIDFAFHAGVSTCVVIPVRSGNGSLDFLAREGFFSEPGLKALEEVLSYGIGLKAGRVFADLWDLDRFSPCDQCYSPRRERLQQMNFQQVILPEVSCSCAH